MVLTMSRRHGWAFFLCITCLNVVNIAKLTLAFTASSLPLPSPRTCRSKESFVTTGRLPAPCVSLHLVSRNYADQNEDVPDPVASVQSLNALVPRATISKLSTRSNFQGLVQLLFHGSALALAASIGTQWLSLLLLAYISSFFFHGLHETVHGTAFRSPTLNKVCRHVFGWLCFRPARHYFYYHWQHHQHTGNRALDPELQTGSFLDLPILNVRTYLVYLSGIPFWIDAVSSLLRHAILGTQGCQEGYLLQSPAKAIPEVVREARIYCGLCLFVAIAACMRPSSFGKFLLHYWILPALLGQPCLRFYLLAEHRAMAEGNHILQTTRTVETHNALTRRLAWCMPYHKEHHAWPSIPFWQLHRAHQALTEAQGGGGGDPLYPSIPCDSYVDFNWRFFKSLLKKKSAA